MCKIHLSNKIKTLCDEINTYMDNYSDKRSNCPLMLAHAEYKHSIFLTITNVFKNTDITLIDDFNKIYDALFQIMESDRRTITMYGDLIHMGSNGTETAVGSGLFHASTSLKVLNDNLRKLKDRYDYEISINVAIGDIFEYYPAMRNKLERELWGFWEEGSVGVIKDIIRGIMTQQVSVELITTNSDIAYMLADCIKDHKDVLQKGVDSFKVE